MPKLNAAFWKWFGKSVVRNEDGSPMVVYHGTPAMPYNIRYVEYLCEAVRIAFKHVGEPYPGDDEIARCMTSWHNTIVEFSRKNPEVIPEDILAQLAQYIPFSTFERGHHYRPDQDARIGFYFTPNERFARHFMSVVEYDPMLDTKREVYVGYPHLYAVYLRIEHPLDLTLATKSNAEFLKATGHLNVETADEVRSYLRSAGGSKMLQQSFARLGVEKLKSLGFDGIINKVKFLGRQEIELSVFDPDQIKSIDNDGTWDAGDPDIRSNPFGDRRVLSRQEAEAYVSAGSIPVTRTEGYTPVFFDKDAVAQQKGPWDWHGTYYFVGEDGDKGLPLGKTFIFNNKIDAMVQLGYSRKKVASRLHYYFDGYHKRGVTIDEFLGSYVSGKTSRWYGDWADNFIAQQAKRSGADNIILLREPNAEHGYNTGTEIVDLHRVKTQHWSEVDLHEMFE